jgi:lipopolysaccharide transport system ATP-binding protein
VVRDGGPSEEIDIEQPFSIDVEWWVLDPDQSPTVTPHLHFRNDQDTVLFVTIGDPVSPSTTDTAGIAVASTSCQIPGNLLAEGRVFLLAGLATFAPPEDHVFEADVASFVVKDSMSGTTARRTFAKDIPGVVRPLLKWEPRATARPR